MPVNVPIFYGEKERKEARDSEGGLEETVSFPEGFVDMDYDDFDRLRASLASDLPVDAETENDIEVGAPKTTSSEADNALESASADATNGESEPEWKKKTKAVGVPEILLRSLKDVWNQHQATPGLWTSNTQFITEHDLAGLSNVSTV